MNIRRSDIMRFCFALLAACLFACGPVRAQDTIAHDVDDHFEVLLLGEKTDVPPREGPVKVLNLDDVPELREEIEETAFAARRIIRDTTRVDWEGTALIVWVDDEREFLEKTGKTAEFTAAAANAARATVWINGRAWRRSTREDKLKVMTHELGHLLVGNITELRRLPLWAEEGIVMHLADEWSFERSIMVSRAHAFNQLPPLEEIESNFPPGGEAQALAYAMAYLASGEVAENHGDERGSVARLMRRLADDTQGPILIERLWNPTHRDAWDAQVRRAMGSRATNLLIALSSGTALWFVAMVLLFIAWRKKRKRRLAAAQEELDEEPWLESLSDDDIQEIYGDREDRFGTEEMPWEKWERMREEEERL